MNTILYKVQAALGARATNIIPVNESTSIEYTTETGIPVTIYQDPENSEGVVLLSPMIQKVPMKVDLSECISVHEKHKGRKSITEVLKESIESMIDN